MELAIALAFALALTNGPLAHGETLADGTAANGNFQHDDSLYFDLKTEDSPYTKCRLSRSNGQIHLATFSGDYFYPQAFIVSFPESLIPSDKPLPAASRPKVLTFDNDIKMKTELKASYGKGVVDLEFRIQLNGQPTEIRRVRFKTSKTLWDATAIEFSSTPSTPSSIFPKNSTCEDVPLG